MFEIYFGRYLIEKGIVSQSAIDDIAGTRYPVFVDELIEKNCFTRDEAEAHLSGFKTEYDLCDDDIDAINSGDISRIAPVFLHFDDAVAIEANLSAYQKDNHLTDAEMENLWKDGGILRILPEYVRNDPKYYNRFVLLTLENILRFITGDVVLRKARQARDYAITRMSCQELKGAHRIFLGFAGCDGNLLAVANMYAKKEFAGKDNKAFDSLCELINTINGIYASELSNEKVNLEIDVPGIYTGKTLKSNGMIYCLPVLLNGVEIEIVFSFDTDLCIA